MTNIYRSILLLIASATHKELVRQVRYLKVECQTLRGKLPDSATLSLADNRREQRLGGLLKHYRRKAA